MTNSSIGSTNFIPSLRQIGSPVEVECHPNRKPCQDCGTSTSTALTSCTCRMLPSRTKLACLKFNGATNSLSAWCKLGKPSCEPIVHPCWKRRPNESKGDETASDKYPSSRKTSGCPSTVSTTNENSWAPDVLITLPWQPRNSPELRTCFPQFWWYHHGITPRINNNGNIFWIKQFGYCTYRHRFQMIMFCWWENAQWRKATGTSQTRRMPTCLKTSWAMHTPRINCHNLIHVQINTTKGSTWNLLMHAICPQAVVAQACRWTSGTIRNFKFALPKRIKFASFHTRFNQINSFT